MVGSVRRGMDRLILGDANYEGFVHHSVIEIRAKHMRDTITKQHLVDKYV